MPHLAHALHGSPSALVALQRLCSLAASLYAIFLTPYPLLPLVTLCSKTGKDTYPKPYLYLSLQVLHYLLLGNIDLHRRSSQQPPHPGQALYCLQISSMDKRKPLFQV